MVSLALGLVCLATASCGQPTSSMPRLYRAKGTAFYTGGGPVIGGAVQFENLADTSYSVSGEVRPDGAFMLMTVKGSERDLGAPEGEYRVTVQPPIGADHRPMAAIPLPNTVRIEPRENTLKLEFPNPYKKP